MKEHTKVGRNSKHAKRNQRNSVHLAWKKESCWKGRNLIVVSYNIEKGYRGEGARLFSDIHNEVEVSQSAIECKGVRKR